jgi:hypothetical protein
VQIENCGADMYPADRVGAYGLIAAASEGTTVANFKAGNREFGMLSSPNSVIGVNAVSVTGLVTQGCNTGLRVGNGRVTLLGPDFYAPDTGTRVGIEVQGGICTAVNANFKNCGTNGATNIVYSGGTYNAL